MGKKSSPKKISQVNRIIETSRRSRPLTINRPNSSNHSNEEINPAVENELNEDETQIGRGPYLKKKTSYLPQISHLFQFLRSEKNLIDKKENRVFKCLIPNCGGVTFYLFNFSN